MQVTPNNTFTISATYEELEQLDWGLNYYLLNLKERIETEGTEHSTGTWERYATLSERLIADIEAKTKGAERLTYVLGVTEDELECINCAMIYNRRRLYRKIAENIVNGKRAYGAEDDLNLTESIIESTASASNLNPFYADCVATVLTEGSRFSVEEMPERKRFI